MLDADDLFPTRDDPEDANANAAAIAAVSARIGLPTVGPCSDGHTRKIVGGVIDGERIAWVEQRSRDAEYEDIADYTLYLRIGDEVVRSWVVDTYNPWFGCTIEQMCWIGDEVLVIYSEKHNTIACMLGLAGPPRLRVLDYRWQRPGDLVAYPSDVCGLVERIRVPELSWCTPLSLADAATAGMTSAASPLAPAATLQPQIVAKLPAISAATAELLIGALAYRFWDDFPPVSSSYQEAYAHDHRWNTPCWLPYYWHHSLAGERARALLAELDLVAARAPAACDPEAPQAELAARHIAARCGELAAACRAGHLPEGTSCYFWVDWSVAAFTDAQALFPAGLWAAWLAMRPQARALRALGERA